MRIYLPYANFSVTAMVLSDHHLYSNLDSLRRVMAAIRGSLVGYKDHPSVIAWEEWTQSLGLLHDVHVRERMRRGSSYSHPTMVVAPTEDIPPLPGYEHPPWLGKFKYHSEERSYLLYLNPDWYYQWNWTEEAGRGG